MSSSRGTFESKLREVYHIHKDTVKGLQGEIEEQKSQFEKLNKIKKKILGKGKAMIKQCDDLKAENNNLRKTLETLKTRNDDQDCKTCIHLYHTLDALKEAYRKSLSEKDKLIKYLEDHLAEENRNEIKGIASKCSDLSVLSILTENRKSEIHGLDSSSLTGVDRVAVDTSTGDSNSSRLRRLKKRPKRNEYIEKPLIEKEGRPILIAVDDQESVKRTSVQSRVSVPVENVTAADHLSDEGGQPPTKVCIPEMFGEMTDQHCKYQESRNKHDRLKSVGGDFETCEMVPDTLAIAVDTDETDEEEECNSCEEENNELVKKAGTKVCIPEMFGEMTDQHCQYQESRNKHDRLKSVGGDFETCVMVPDTLAIAVDTDETDEEEECNSCEEENNELVKKAGTKVCIPEMFGEMTDQHCQYQESRNKHDRLKSVGGDFETCVMVPDTLAIAVDTDETDEEEECNSCEEENNELVKKAGNGSDCSFSLKSSYDTMNELHQENKMLDLGNLEPKGNLLAGKKIGSKTGNKILMAKKDNRAICCSHSQNVNCNSSQCWTELRGNSASPEKESVADDNGIETEMDVAEGFSPPLICPSSQRVLSEGCFKETKEMVVLEIECTDSPLSLRKTSQKAARRNCTYFEKSNDVKIIEAHNEDRGEQSLIAAGVSVVSPQGGDACIKTSVISKVTASGFQERRTKKRKMSHYNNHSQLRQMTLTQNFGLLSPTKFKANRRLPKQKATLQNLKPKTLAKDDCCKHDATVAGTDNGLQRKLHGSSLQEIQNVLLLENSRSRKICCKGDMKLPAALSVHADSKSVGLCKTTDLDGTLSPTVALSVHSPNQTLKSPDCKQPNVVSTGLSSPLNESLGPDVEFSLSQQICGLEQPKNIKHCCPNSFSELEMGNFLNPHDSELQNNSCSYKFGVNIAPGEQDTSFPNIQGSEEVIDADDQVASHSPSSSFDRVPRKENIPYAYTDVVRKKVERQRLKGYSCKECHEYYKAQDLPEEEIEQRIQHCSRHRAKYLPPKTPEHFWSIGFPDTPECEKRGYIMRETQLKPSSHRRRKQLAKKFKSRMEELLEKSMDDNTQTAEDR